MTNAAGARKGTAGRTAPRTADMPLVLTVRPTPTCARCGVVLDNPRVNQRYCSGKDCRQRDNEQKWAEAPAAVWGVLVAGAIAGAYAWDEIRTEADVYAAFEWCIDAREAGRRQRRTQLMVDFGLEWDSRARAWQKGER